MEFDNVDLLQGTKKFMFVKEYSCSNACLLPHDTESPEEH